MSVTIPIVQTEDVLGGKPRIEGTRISVYLVGELVHEQGWDYAEFADAYDLSEPEVDAALEYYDTHPEEMAAIRERKAEVYEQIRAQSRAPE